MTAATDVLDAAYDRLGQWGFEPTDEATTATALAQVKAEHAALYARTEPLAVDTAPDISEDTLVQAAIASGEAHAVKLVEACRRGVAATGDPVFVAAAARVVRRGLRTLTHDSGPEGGVSS